MSIYKNLWSPGYALPAYVKAEPPGRGTFTTAWLPRGTISQILPDNMAQPATTLTPAKGHSLSGTIFSGGHSLSGSSLAGSSLGNHTGAQPGSPFATYGQKAAGVIVAALAQIKDPAEKKEFLKKLLDEIEPGLYAKVKDAPNLGAALRTHMTAGIEKEIIELGKAKQTKKAKHFKPKGKPASMSGYQATGAWYNKLYDNTLGAVFGLACDVAGNPATPVLAAGVSSAYGATPATGAAGAQVAQAACKSGSKPAPQPGVFPGMSEWPAWVVPAAVGGGALLLILALRKG